MRFSIFFLLGILTFNALGQDCSCADDFEFVVQYYEANLPAYRDNVTPETVQDYNNLKEQLYSFAKAETSINKCFKLLTTYVEYFKDNHSRISMQGNSVDETNSEAVKEFQESRVYQDRETYTLSSAQLEQFPQSDIRGLYETKDGIYTITIVPNKTALRDYVGVITDSKTPLWREGQIKLELKKIGDNQYSAYSYMRNHSLQYNANYRLQNGILGDSWFKTSKKDRFNNVTDASATIDFKVLDATTTYLRIPSFSGNEFARLDSLYKKVDPIIKSHSNLIIDVRNNGGGSDRNVIPLIPYLYTNPIQSDEVELYVTAGNIAMWERWYQAELKDTINNDKAYLDEFKAEVDLIKKAPLGSFINRSEGENTSYTLDRILSSPSKVVILTNKYCASSCESLLFVARQSTKTNILGENSGGYVGYGEVGDVRTPSYGYRLFCTMTRYMKERAFEVVGVPADVYLNTQEDWIGQTQQWLKNQ